MADDDALARAMVAYLRERNLVNERQLHDAGVRFEQGALPSTALRLAGVSREAVLGALAAASGVPVAPPPARWTSDALKLTPIADVSWTKARAVPIGIHHGRVQVAFADPRRVRGAEGALPPHDACVCLEEDLDAALRALHDGMTVGFAASPITDPDATVAGTPPPALSSAADVVAGRGAVALAPTQVGPWHIDRMIAQGGMGVVYLGHDDARRNAAVKLVHGHLLHLPDVRTRFLREARANQKLRHKNIVSVLDVGEGEPAYLAVEFVDAGTVSSLLQHAGGKLPVAAALDVLVQTLDGLVAAHAAHIVHRDLKPSNLLLSSDGTVKIADFGIARELDATALTQTGSTLGTPAYMSPEQALAEPIDGRSDIYTAGVIAYTLIAGRNPFEAESLGATVAGILKGRVPSLFELDPGVPDVVDELVSVLMHRNKEQRPPNAQIAAQFARTIFDEVRGARAHPLADLLRDPAGATQQLERERAGALVERAKALLPQAGQREAAALTLFRAAAIDGVNAEAKRLLDGLRADGIAFGAASPKLVELEKEVAAHPDDPLLLQRAGQLARQEGNLHKAAAYWRRALRVRPDDAHLAQQLARLTGEHDPLKAASTLSRIAGHIATGGFASGSPLEVGGRPQPPLATVAPPSSRPPPRAPAEATDGAGLFDGLSLGKIAIALVVVVVLAIGVKVAGKIMKSASLGFESEMHNGGVVHPAKDDIDEGKSEQDQDVADEANNAGDFASAEKRATAGIERGARHSVLGRLYLARGVARLGLHKPLAAVEDLSTVIQGFRDDDTSYSEALLRRGMAHAQSNDPDHAVADFTTCIDGRANPPIAAKARLERGRIKAAKGDTAGAKEDFEWARDYVTLGDPTRAAAKEELTKIGVTSD